MTEVFTIDLSERERRAHRLMARAGIGFGLVFGLGFAIFAWGADAWLLASHAAPLYWTKLVFGLPLALLVGGLAGWLAARTSMAISVLIWVAVGWLLGTTAGHIPFDGGNLAIWLLEERLWGEVIYPFDESTATRTTLVVLICVIIGAAVGFLENLAVEWSWDRATPDGRMSRGSWLVLLVALPLALGMALAVNGFITQPLRMPQVVVGELIQMTLAGETRNTDAFENSQRSIAPFEDRLQDSFENHYVSFGSDTGAWYSAYVDVVFPDGQVLRCVVSGQAVIYCDDYSTRIANWVDDLVRAGLYGERPWLEEKMRLLAVDETVLAWLETHKAQLSENFTVERETQQTSWIFMHVVFDNGFEMVCRFRDASPVVVDQCVEASSSP